VLVVRVADAPVPPRRRLRRVRPKDSDAEPEAERLPVSTLTAIRPEPLGDHESARGWLQSVRDDDEAIEAELVAALALINRAMHAQRTSTLDPHLADLSPDRALAVRIGYGTGDEVSDGRYSAAIDIPRSARRRRIESLRPQERIAAVLGRRERILPAEDLLLRARADLDAGRPREAALQLRVGLEALLAEQRSGAPEGEAKDLGTLDERRSITGKAANEALTGDLAEPRVAEVAETLRLCERVLRRRRLT
jgi:hypothetical protein